VPGNELQEYAPPRRPSRPEPVRLGEFNGVTLYLMT
jgi:hypothetical protein